MIRFVRLMILSFALVAAAGMARAYAQALPQTPNAEAKAQQGGMTAGASVEREGGSALEPYLIVLLIPVFGLVIFGSCVYVDRTMRKSA